MYPTPHALLSRLFHQSCPLIPFSMQKCSRSASYSVHSLAN